MFSVCSSLRCLVPQWRRRSGNFWILFHSNRTVRIASSSSMNEDSASLRKQSQPDFDPAEDLFGLDVDLQPRNVVSVHPNQGPGLVQTANISRELPCPSCRGRGYTPCTECGIERSRLDCSECNGKGLRTCKQCLGDCVIWEESIDERPWEKARSSSPLKVKEDDEVDKLDIKFDVTRKSKRVYQSPSPEVSLKISRSLRSLNAKTGLFSKHMKILHRDPTLHAQRVAAIKKAKGTAAARKKASETMKTFFRHPENRIKRSMSMIGVKFYCSNCGEEGHRRYYCPAVKDSLGGKHKFKCRLCGERGHNRRTCRKSRSGEPQRRRVEPKHHHHCTVCGQGGHNRRTCPRGTAGMKGGSSIPNKILTTSRGIKFYCSNCGEEGHRRNHCPALEESLGGRHKCRLCGAKGHNRRTCPKSRLGEPQRRRWDQRHHQHCRVCGNSGHNRRTCPQGTSLKSSSSTPNKVLQSYKGRTYSCSLCSVKGHNIRTCPNRNNG